MNSQPIRCHVVLFSLLFGSICQTKADEVDYNRDIRPLLSDNCYQCHGPDAGERASDMRLDLRSASVDFATEAGPPAIKAGDRGASEVYQRIRSDDESIRMPPPDSGKSLTAAEAELIGKWIDQGANYREHWAFIAPVKSAPPKTEVSAGAPPARNAIDHYIRRKAIAAHLTPSVDADRRTLIRRLSFDLTGLPPTPAEIEAFLKDQSANAYEKLVDRLLANERYGEHMAHYWLDAARYGDTHGLHLDNERSIWPYRDWVIQAFNQNKPFDQFTVEQLAGDLLPKATVQQRIASGFNRCNVTTSEGGAIRKEFRTRYAIDRVETTATVWLGLTAGCAACHDHKFDPLSQKEFYQLYSYFYSFQEDAMDGNKLLPAPVVAVMDPKRGAEIQTIQQQIKEFKRRIADRVAETKYQEPPTKQEPTPAERREFVWIEDAAPVGGKGAGDWKFVTRSQGKVFSGEKSSHRVASGLSQHYVEGANPPLIVGEGDTVFAYVYLDPQNPPREIMLQFNVNGWNHRAIWGDDLIDWGAAGTASRKPMGPLPETGKWVRLEFPASEVGLTPGSKVHGWAYTQFDGSVYWDKSGIVTKTPQAGERFASLKKWSATLSAKTAAIPKPVLAAASKAEQDRSENEKRRLRDYFVEFVYSESRSTFEPLHTQVQALEAKAQALEKSKPQSLVMGDKPKPLETFVLIRGEYDREDKDQPVKPGVPAVLPPLPNDAPPNRLGLARWIVDRDNPLTARVTVNRIWQQIFGAGIVATSEDFGSQGQWPSHPELLDWLAVEFMESGWDVKHIVKLMVMSSTYRQTSNVTASGQENDPANRLLARGPRFRLDAESIRDNALACSGLLVERIGGKGVRPYQPAGLWNAVGYTSSNTANFRRDAGENLYRRSLYTFWKRTSPPPVMAIFDAPSREACTVRRSRTNTPQQALLTMNDEQFVEASRAFAERMLKEGGPSAAERLRFAFEVATARRPLEDEVAILQTVLASHHKHYADRLEEAKKLIAAGESKPDPALDPVQLAAYTMTANLILNLDETLTKN